MRRILQSVLACDEVEASSVVRGASVPGSEGGGPQLHFPVVHALTLENMPGALALVAKLLNLPQSFGDIVQRSEFATWPASAVSRLIVSAIPVFEANGMLRAEIVPRDPLDSLMARHIQILTRAAITEVVSKSASEACVGMRKQDERYIFHRHHIISAGLVFSECRCGYVHLSLPAACRVVVDHCTRAASAESHEHAGLLRDVVCAVRLLRRTRRKELSSSQDAIAAVDLIERIGHEEALRISDMLQTAGQTHADVAKYRAFEDIIEPPCFGDTFEMLRKSLSLSTVGHEQLHLKRPRRLIVATMANALGVPIGETCAALRKNYTVSYQPATPSTQKARAEKLARFEREYAKTDPAAFMPCASNDQCIFPLKTDIPRPYLCIAHMRNTHKHIPDLPDIEDLGGLLVNPVYIARHVQRPV